MYKQRALYGPKIEELHPFFLNIAFFDLINVISGA